jgi:hypothetical protein
MTIDRAIWLWGFDRIGPTPWPCPSCNGARLHIVKDTLHLQETSESRVAHSHLAWEPDWIDGRSVCMLQCPDCQNPSSVAGVYRVHEEYVDIGEGEPDIRRVDTFEPKFFQTHRRSSLHQPACLTTSLTN